MSTITALSYIRIARERMKLNKITRSGEMINLLASSSRSRASNSLLGGYLGKVDGSHARGFVMKNWKRKLMII